MEKFNPKRALSSGGCGERQLEGGWWDHWTQKLTVGWLVYPQTRKRDSWEEATWDENRSQTLTSTNIHSKEWGLDEFRLWSKLCPLGIFENSRGIGTQFVGFNSWVYSGKETVKESPDKTSVIPR